MEEKDEILKEKRTWGAKIPTELREQIDTITEKTGMRGEELLTNLVESFDLNQTKLSAPKFEKDINSLENYTKGIVSCIKNIVQTAVDMEIINEEKSNRQVQEKEEQIRIIQEGLDEEVKNNIELQELNTKYFEEKLLLEKSLYEAKESNRQTNDIIDLKDIIISTKNKEISDLNNKIESSKLLVEENEKCYVEITDLEYKGLQLEQELIRKDNDINAKEIKIDGLISQIEFFKNQLGVAKKEYKEEIRDVKLSMNDDFDNRIQDMKEVMKEDFDSRLQEIKEREEEKLMKDGIINDLQEAMEGPEE